MVAALALFTEVALGLMQRSLTPQGLRSEPRARKVSALPAGTPTSPAAKKQAASVA